MVDVELDNGVNCRVAFSSIYLIVKQGWLSGRFGLFGIQPNTVTDPLMNVFGAVLALLSAILFAAIKTTVSTTETREKHQVHRAHDEEEHVPSTEKDPLLAEGAPLETPLTRGLEGEFLTVHQS